MSERKTYNNGLKNIGELLERKRKSLGPLYESRQSFIETRSDELFGGEAWISLRHLANIENGKNWISIEKLVQLSVALEEDPVDLFEEILNAYKQ